MSPEEPKLDLESSSNEARQPNPPPPPTSSSPPEETLLAWTQVLCMHLVCFNTWGICNSFGTFQQYYTSTSTISWIGGLQTSLLFFIGVIAGRATDAGYSYRTFTLGVALQLLGIFTTSVCSTFWQILLAQGVCVGLGNGFTFTSGLAVMSPYFMRKRAFVVGVGAAGSAVGGLVDPVIVDRLLYHEDVGVWVDDARDGVYYAGHASAVYIPLQAAACTEEERAVG